jgi:O-antigen/teichoic acid export membrane protein
MSFERRGQFAWKVALLLGTTVALIPILLSKNQMAATVYLWVLVAVHLAGLAIIAVGVKRHHIAPDGRGLAIRLVGIAILVGLLYLASKGLDGSVEGFVFWGSLFAIWALHTAGLALLHIRSGREAAACPFV